MKSHSSTPEESERRDGIAGAFLAFAAMMKHDYGVNKKVALKALALAYDMDKVPPVDDFLSKHPSERKGCHG